MHARYAIAVWTLARAPGGRRLWPTLGSWAPQPYVELGQEHKRYEPEVFLGRSAREGGVRAYAPVLRATDRRGAAELAVCCDGAGLDTAQRRCSSVRHVGALSGHALAVRASAHRPHAVSADCVASVCEDRKSAANPAMHARWQALRTRLGLLDELNDHGLDATDIEGAERRLSDVRNIAAHGTDSVLVNLGYPAERRRVFGKRERSGEELALAQLYSELRPMQWMVRQALQRVWSTVAAAGFSDEAFGNCFEP